MKITLDIDETELAEGITDELDIEELIREAVRSGTVDLEGLVEEALENMSGLAELIAQRIGATATAAPTYAALLDRVDRAAVSSRGLLSAQARLNARLVTVEAALLAATRVFHGERP